MPRFQVGQLVHGDDLVRHLADGADALLEVAAGVGGLARDLEGEEDAALARGDDVAAGTAGLGVEDAARLAPDRSITGREEGEAISSSPVMRPASGAGAPPKRLKAASTKALSTSPPFMSTTPGP
jgi:hypothetical protein